MSNAKILIVEDDRIIVELICTILEPLGYSITATAPSGEEAIQNMAEMLPDLVLMDIHLQGKMDGIDAAEHIRKQYDVPVVYLSAHADDELLERARITAPFGYVLKPFKKRDLSLAIEIALYRHDMEAKMRKLNDELERRVEERTAELEESLGTLHTTLTQLAQAEKMAALGGLVAGMTHELSNPLGISVMAVSHLEGQTQTIRKQFVTTELTRSELGKYLQQAQESISIIQKNLYRTSDLLNSFKQMAVDQMSERKRGFCLSEYIQEILLSLKPTLKVTNHTVTVDCPADLCIHSYPGVFSQIVTNLVMNSLIHGFENIDDGNIHIWVKLDSDVLYVHYTDNGKGIPEENLPKLFDLFYTTRRGQGSSGIGLNIVRSLVTQRFGGQIACNSSVGKGTSFTICIPAAMVKDL